MGASPVIEIPGYTVLRLLGHGGMATVYLALQQSLRREVALKILSPALAQDSIATERFLREARISAKLHHPHIVAIYDVGLHDGVPYMSIAYEPGGTVASKTQTRSDPKVALRIIRDIASALDYAHSQGVIHRDVKPENILLRHDGTCVLSDFGIAHAVEGAQAGLTREGTSVGTPHYMSPEQLRGEHVDGRSDLYSLGVVFYQLLTGDLPYQGTDGWAIGMQHISAPIPHLPPQLAHLQTFLDAMLAKDPARRLQTGAEVVQWVDARLSGQTAAMTVAMPTPIPPATSGQRTSAASIAILPFADMSQSKDQEYLADGLTEELLNLLSKVPGLFVASRSSAASFKGKSAKPAEVGRELKVATVLEGSVRKFGERVRISVQLINVDDGFQRWSETYDRQLTDVFAVQDEIAALVVAALKEQLLPKKAPAAPAVDPEIARQAKAAKKAQAREREAAEKAAAEAREREAAEKAAAEAREREAREKAAAEAREREAREKAAAEARAREAAEMAAAEARDREAAAQAVAAALAREEAEKAAAQARELEAAEKAAAAARERAAAEKSAAIEARLREANEKAAAEARRREAEAQAAAEAKRREAEAQAAAETKRREEEAQAAAEAKRREEAALAAAEAKRREVEAQAAEDAKRRETEKLAAAEAMQREAEAREARRRDEDAQAAADARRREADAQAAAEQAVADARRRELDEQAAAAAAAAASAAAEARQRQTAELPATAALPASEQRTLIGLPAAGDAVRDPASEFASAFLTKGQPETGSGPSSSRAPPSPPPAKKLITPMRGGIAAVVVLALGGWLISVYLTQQREALCQSSISAAKSASDAGEFDKAASASLAGAQACRGEALTQLQALDLVIQEGKAKAQACELSETKARDFLDKGLPGLARVVIEQATAKCGLRPAFSELAKRHESAESEAKTLIDRASSLVAANALDEAQALIDQALKLDANSDANNKLRDDLAARRAKLPTARTAPTKSTPTPAAASPAATAAAEQAAKLLLEKKRREEMARQAAAEAGRRPPPPTTTPPGQTTPAVPVAQLPAPPPPTSTPTPAPTPTPARPEPARSPLVPISTPQPKYPTQAMRAKISGTVTVAFTVGASGDVTEVRIVSATPAGVFDRAVLTAVGRWKFQPMEQSRSVTRSIAFQPE